MNTNNPKNLITILREGTQFELIENFWFYFPSNQTYYYQFLPQSLKKALDERRGELYLEVPKGFQTDFGTIPLVFQSLISPIGKPTKSFVVHDYLCVCAQEGKLSRKLADRIFLECMKIQKVRWLKRTIIYYAVRAFARFKGLK